MGNMSVSFASKGYSQQSDSVVAQVTRHLHGACRGCDGLYVLIPARLQWLWDDKTPMLTELVTSKQQSVQSLTLLLWRQRKC